MTDYIIDFQLDHFDKLIEQGRVGLYAAAVGHRDHEGHRIGACPSVVEAWDLLHVARMFRSEIARTSKAAA